jgi:hypothetical protein
VVAFVVSTLVTCAEISTFSDAVPGLEVMVTRSFPDMDFDSRGLGFKKARFVYDQVVGAGGKRVATKEPSG